MRFLNFSFMLLFAFQIAHAQNQKIYNPTKFLALGDSYTIGESVSEAQRWPNQLFDSLKLLGISGPKPKIIATTGWRTDQLKNAILNSGLNDTFNLVSVLIGVNNQYQGRSLSQQRKEFPEILNLAIEKAGGDTAKVFVVSIPDYAFTPFGQSKNPSKISTELDVYNAINDSIAAVYGVKYFDITPISRNGLTDPSLVANDGLHPSGKQYGQWVNLIMKRIEVEQQMVVVKEIKKELGSLVYNQSQNTIEIKDMDRIKGLNDSLRIFDISGKVVFSKQVANNPTPIRLTNLKPGNYIVNLNGFEPLQIIILNH